MQLGRSFFIMLSVIFILATAAYARDLNKDLANAAKKGDTKAVKFYLAKGADVNAKDALGQTALIYAATYGYAEIVQALLDQGADMKAKDLMGMPAIGCAARNGHFKTVEVLLASGADVNAKDDQYGGSTLMTATYYNRPDIVKILITKGADVNLKNKKGESALSLAKYKGLIEIIQILKEAGAKE